MKTYLDCYSCFLRQALDAARMAGASEQEQVGLVRRVLSMLLTVETDRTPPEIGGAIHAVVREVTRCDDPYQEVKNACTREALDLHALMEKRVAESPYPLDTALRVSIAGNIIDFGPGSQYDLMSTLERVLKQPFATDDAASLEDELRTADHVLMLADNAGETVFDRPLIEAIEQPVFYAVKAGPVLNDATVDDARSAGIDQIAAIVSTGSRMPGTILRDCSDEFRSLFTKSEIVLAKGQANYETLSDVGSRVYFLLQVKCPVIARDLRVPVGGIVVQQGAPTARRAACTGREGDHTHAP